MLEKDLAPAAVARFLEVDGADFPHVSGAVVFVLTLACAVVEETWPVPNPHAFVRVRNLSLPEVREPTRRERWALEDPYAIPANAERPGS
ncbi:MAG TPA: hypothetical protein ENJ16_02140 [Planctomycetaceae bacterium]|nr:hypothetical protein [Planctomycetaceae bacterium]